MADYQLQKQTDGTFKNIDYMKGGDGFALFLNGGKGADGNIYPKVDLSLWDQATMCGTCHVGGVFYEQDRNGNRLPQKTFDDWMPAFQGGAPNLNPVTSTVWENYSTTTGKDKSFVTMSPWAYPVYTGRGGAPDPNATDGGPMTVKNGWIQGRMQMANNNDPSKPYTVVAGQLVMPNVKEMDCLFCHLKGYDNVMASVMTQAGSLSAAPTTGAGLFDMFPLSPSYMGYDPKTGKTSFTSLKTAFGLPALQGMGFASYSSHEVVTLTEAFTANIKGKPDDNNCHQCHATKTLKDFPEMFGVTGGSTGFLSSAPMVFDPANGVGPNGKRMVSYDINAPFGPSEVITPANMMSNFMTGLPYLAAMGSTPYNNLTDPTQLGGGNPQSGPLYYSTVDKVVNQNILKKSTMPFPRAEWFKRGDAWQTGQDVHSTFGCAGCHFTGNSTDKNQCDPARGFDMASTVQDGLPAFKNRMPVLEDGDTTGATTIKKHDTRNTVKRCEFCHVTGKDYYGNAIETYGAPNPNVAHTNAGLLANINQIVDSYKLHGNWGGKGVPRMTNFTSNDTETKVAGEVTATNPGGTILGRGNHLDVMDCTVCHVKKVSMAVRSLDASSGMRFPAIVGTDPIKGMFGLFEDPTNGANPAYGGQLKQWEPLHLWQAMGNSLLPLSTSNTPADPESMKFRRKLYLSNAITAVLWNNEDENIDANGDGVKGGVINNDKPSLVGYKDIFTGDDLDENNTASYGIPLFDPWIQKDLKSGFNFGAAPLSVISVGFGGADYHPAGISNISDDGSYASLYSNQGYFQGDKWKYASVWSGAVVFTEPDQIANYKKYRTEIASATDGKSWTNTTLTLVGAPFMVTHGVKPTGTYVKGKTCAECHAEGAGFFKGGFDMVGPALPASPVYDATAALVLKDGNIDLDDNGDGIRATGAGAEYMNGAYMLPPHMFYRPLEKVRIKANPGDLRGYLETHNKLGQPREVNFVKPTGNGQFVTASTVERWEAMYPPEDGAIYFKVGQVNADGSVNNGAAPMTGLAYATYLETQVDTNLANYGIGVNPTAVINPVTDDSALSTGVQWVQNVNHTISAAFAQPNAGKTADVGTVSYLWSTTATDVTIGNPNAQSTTFSFANPGTKTIKLTVTDEEGKTSIAYLQVEAIVAPMGIAWANSGIRTGTATFSNYPATTTKIVVNWGDGLTTTRSGTYLPANNLAIAHTYSTATSKTIKMYCYNSAGAQVGYMAQTITP